MVWRLTINVEVFLLHREEELLTVLHLEVEVLEEDLLQDTEILIADVRPWVSRCCIGIGVQCLILP